MTTDPIELWSRIEKDIFDSNFGPFYRVEQIIIKSKLSSFIYTNDDGKKFELGPAFNATFLLDVLSLQEGIESIM